MKIYPWFPKNVDYSLLIPDLPVWTLELKTSDLPRAILCDMAWDNKEETKSHFWIKTNLAGGKVKILSMSLREYLILHMKHIRGMNGFWEIGRSEFISRWEAVHGPLHPGGFSR